MGIWYQPFMLLGDAVIATDSEHQILEVNSAYEEASGFDRTELIGKNAGYIKSGLTSRHIYDSLKSALAQKRTWKGILTNRKPDGTLWNASVTITPIRINNIDTGYIGISRDIQNIHIQDIAASYENLFTVIAKTAESTDPTVEGHLQRVSQITEIIAKGAGVPEQVVMWYKAGSVLHDVGKNLIPKEILFKPGRLDEAEREFIKAHTILGEKFLENLHDCMAKIFGYHESLEIARVMACSHHERYDGNGYPYRLKGEEIPLGARIVAIADVVDALLSKRPYKHSWSFEEVLTYLEKEKGKHFDPALVDILIENWNSIRNLY